MIGSQLRELRRNKKLTQAELASCLGVSNGAIGLWELNQREPDCDTLIRIAEFFNVSIDYLLGNEAKNTITIIGRNGYYKRFTLTEESLQKFKNELEKMDDSNNT